MIDREPESLSPSPSPSPSPSLSPSPSPPPGEMLRDWDARAYLDYYYGEPVVPADETAMFQFVARALRGIGTRLSAGLDLGCGPVVHRAAQVVPWVDRLDMADVQPVNLDEIRRWIDRAPGAFDWSVLIGGPGGVLEAEGGGGGSEAERDGGGSEVDDGGGGSEVDDGGGGSEAEGGGGGSEVDDGGGGSEVDDGGAGGRGLAEREALLRQRIRLMPCDLREAHPLGAPLEYPLVTTYYCAEWVTPTLAGWRETLGKVAALVARGGWLLMIGAHATDYCVINGRRIPCAHVREDELRSALAELGFDPKAIQLERTPGVSPAACGIQETFMLCARRAS